jgi:hypothetical protein
MPEVPVSFVVQLNRVISVEADGSADGRRLELL